MFGQGTVDPWSVAFLDPEEDEGADPRRKLFQSLAGMSMMGGDNETEGGSGGGGESDNLRDFNPALRNMVPPSPSQSESPSASMESAASHNVPGFDDQTGLPTEYPATGRKEAAAARLEKAQHPNHPLLQALLKAGVGVGGTLAASKLGGVYAGAGAAKGFQQGEMLSHEREMEGRGIAQHQYEFEAQQEEKQREAALHEKIAVAQIGAQKAYRNLLIEMQRRSRENTVRGQNMKATESGFNVEPGGDPTHPNLTPRSVDQLSVPQQGKVSLDQAKLDATQAITELNKAKTKMLPEQLKLAQSRLDVALEHLKLSAQGMSLRDRQFEVMYGSGVDPVTGRFYAHDETGAPVALGAYSKIGPSTQSRSRGDAARGIQPLIERARDILQEHPEAAGPFKGRWADIERNIGNMSGPSRELAGTLMSIYSLGGTMHGWRSIEVASQFAKVYGGLEGTPESLNAGLDAMKNTAKTVEGVSQAAPGSAQHFVPGSSLGRPQGQAPVAPKLQRRTPGGAGGGGGTSAPPPGSKVRSWQEFVQH